MWLIEAYGARSFSYQDPDEGVRRASRVMMPDAYLCRLAPDPYKTNLLLDEESGIKRRAFNPNMPLNLTNLPFDPATAAGQASLKITEPKPKDKK